MSDNPWYTQYEALSDRVQQLKVQFIQNCAKLGIDPDLAVQEVWSDIVIRAVHESNWQEGIYVERGKTRELALHIFDDLASIPGPHLNINLILETHKRLVINLKRKAAQPDEIAVLNLSAAHLAIRLIGQELSSRQAASLLYALNQFQNLLRKGEINVPLDSDSRSAIQRGFRLSEELISSKSAAYAPITDDIRSEGVLLQHLLSMDFNDLLNPMKIDYIHFLHRMVMMGIADPKKCGMFRSSPVHVGNPKILFPPPSALQALMERFCKSFPTILPTTVKYDPIIKAAVVSHEFVRIHPYHDGNGRMSRLLMNLVLWGHHPPVYLKANKKGRHRYSQALRRADTGDIRPLACLVAMSLIEIYAKIIASLAPAVRMS